MRVARCKFVCSLKDESSGTVYLSPVYTGSKENEQFFQATPGGQIQLCILNKSALESFRPGREYYVDFTKVLRMEKIREEFPNAQEGMQLTATAQGLKIGASRASDHYLLDLVEWDAIAELLAAGLRLQAETDSTQPKTQESET